MNYRVKNGQKILILLLILIAVFITQKTYISTPNITVPIAWSKLQPILIARATQNKPKRKLSQDHVKAFVTYLNHLNTPTPQLKELQMTLPKTTLELLMAVYQRGVPLAEAEKMAAYLKQLTEKDQFQNIHAFDENTSHIIGREWHEIDYSGEHMTWQKQRLKYLPYGVIDFKTKEHLIDFFQVESQLPYFKRIYRPQN